MADDPILLIVRRGAHRRFEALERKTSHLDVKVIWDRRERNQRESIGVVSKEQRASDRRSHGAPASWQLADFTVAVPRTSRRS